MAVPEKGRPVTIRHGLFNWCLSTSIAGYIGLSGIFVIAIVGMIHYHLYYKWWCDLIYGLVIVAFGFYAWDLNPRPKRKA